MTLNTAERKTNTILNKMRLKVAFPNVTYYPLIIRSEAGKVTGVYIDLLNELAKFANFREVYKILQPNV